MIDFHIHLDLYPNISEVLNGIFIRQMYVLSVTTTPSAWEGTYELSKGIPYIKTALGLHPQLAHERYSELHLFDKWIHKTNYVGEVGLDGAESFKDHLYIQTLVFQHILKSCENAGGKILSIHSRHAVTEVLDHIEKYPKAGIFILHWFTGNKTQLKRAVELGCWFSVGPAMLETKKGRDLVSKMPINKLITETDGPFTKIDNNTVMPWNVSLAIEKLASILNIPIDDMDRMLDHNIQQLLE